jgi:hypothetical protein
MKFQDKLCGKCGEMFTPKGARSKFCDRCKEEAAAASKKPETSNPDVPPPPEPQQKPQPQAPDTIEVSNGISVCESDPLLVTVDLRQFPVIMRQVVGDTVKKLISGGE